MLWPGDKQVFRRGSADQYGLTCLRHKLTIWIRLCLNIRWNSIFSRKLSSYLGKCSHTLYLYRASIKDTWNSINIINYDYIHYQKIQVHLPTSLYSSSKLVRGVDKMEGLFAEAHAMLLQLYKHLADSETQKWLIRSQHGAQEDDTRYFCTSCSSKKKKPQGLFPKKIQSTWYKSIYASLHAYLSFTVYQSRYNEEKYIRTNIPAIYKSKFLPCLKVNIQYSLWVCIFCIVNTFFCDFLSFFYLDFNKW